MRCRLNAPATVGAVLRLERVEGETGAPDEPIESETGPSDQPVAGDNSPFAWMVRHRLYRMTRR